MTRKAAATPSAAEVSVRSSEIARITGATPPLLPGESEQEYLAGREGAIEELGAKTHLQIYLAQKIFDCLWWMRNYEIQKRAALIDAMADQLTSPIMSSARRLEIIRAIASGDWYDKPLAGLLRSEGLTPEVLLANAMSNRAEQLEGLEAQIALRTKTLTSLQASYEALVNRKILRERMQLQNDLMRRDLEAIDVPALPLELQKMDRSTPEGGAE